LACLGRRAYAVTLHAAGDIPGALEQLGRAFDSCDRVDLPLYEAQAAAAMADVYTGTDPTRAVRDVGPLVATNAESNSRRGSPTPKGWRGIHTIAAGVATASRRFRCQTMSGRAASCGHC
jgi:hypothetical protein